MWEWELRVQEVSRHWEPEGWQSTLLKTWPLETKTCDILAPPSRYLFQPQSPHLQNGDNNLPLSVSVSREGEMRWRVQVLRKEVHTFYRTPSLYDRKGGFSLCTASVVQSSTHWSPLIWGVEISCFSGSGFSQKILVKIGSVGFADTLAWQNQKSTFLGHISVLCFPLIFVLSYILLWEEGDFLFSSIYSFSALFPSPRFTIPHLIWKAWTYEPGCHPWSVGLF